MSRVGVCTVYPDVLPTTEELKELGLSTVRLFTYSLDELKVALDLLGPSVQAFVTVNNQWKECGSEFENWLPFIYQLARVHENNTGAVIRAVGLINEPDIWYYKPPVGEPDTKLTPEWCAQRVLEAAPILWDVGIQPVLPSVASEFWQEYLYQLTGAVKGKTDIPLWADLHLYVKKAKGVPNYDNWQDMVDALGVAYNISRMPVCSSEGGIKVSDAGGEITHAIWVGNWASVAQGLHSEMYPELHLFCWSDRAGSPGEHGDNGFGLRRDDHSKRPAWYTLMSVMGGGEPIYKLGFLEIANKHRDLIGEPVTNEKPPKPGVHYASQRTTNGLLWWTRAQLADNPLKFDECKGFSDFIRGGEYLWNGSRLVRQ